MKKGGEFLSGYLIRRAQVEQTQTRQQTEAPIKREVYEQRKAEAVERAYFYLNTAKRITEARVSGSSQYNSEELRRVEDLLLMRFLAMGETHAYQDGTMDNTLRNTMEKLEKRNFPNYTNIVAEFSQEKKPDNQ